jgi:hypothetical protein
MGIEISNGYIYEEKNVMRSLISIDMAFTYTALNSYKL